MANPHGSFIWYELLTTDPDAAARFYADVIGWQVAPFDLMTSDYRIFSAADGGVAGMMALPADAQASGMSPGWLGYVGVDEVDVTVDAIVQAGGAVHVPPTDLPGVGRMAMVADPQGVVFYVMRGASEEASPSFDPDMIGHCAWNELVTSDMPAALAFYSDLFGWTKGDAMSMGAMGDYQFLEHHGRMFGATMMGQQPGPPPAWGFYFKVEDIKAAAGRATDRGATILYGPAEVPGGDHIIVATDPQGAAFALVGTLARGG